MKFFVSYSHKDKDLLEKLQAHLSPIKRHGDSTAWYDREIDLGGDIDGEVQSNLADSDVFLACVSSAYIQSKYCYDIELRTALERHEKGDLTLIPIILRPCQWRRTLLGKLKAAPEDGKAVTEWSNEDSAFSNIVEGLFKIIDARRRPATAAATPTKVETTARSARYRPKRKFDDLERSDFRDAAFQTILGCFEIRVKELNTQDGLKGKLIRIDSDGFTCSVVNRHLSERAEHVTVYAGRNRDTLGDIYYSYEESARRTGANGGFNIEADDYHMYLQPSLFRGDEKSTDAEGAATYIWNDLLKRAGIDHA